METATATAIPSAATLAHWEKKTTQISPTFPPLESVTKPNLTTAELGYYLNRRPQTLRGWACNEDGPIRPRRTNGRLDWPTVDAKRIAGVPA